MGVVENGCEGAKGRKSLFHGNGSEGNGSLEMMRQEKLHHRNGSETHGCES